MNHNDQRLLIRSLDGGLTPAEELRLQRLLAGSAEARIELELQRTLRSLVAQQSADSFAPFFVDRVMQRATAAPQTGARTMNGFFRSVSPFPKPAAVGLAVVALMAIVALSLWLRPTTVNVAHGTTETVMLPDGSTVELSSGSTLAYRPFRGRAERRVSLTGEAFFDVNPDGKPFKVATFNAQVEVKGTRFNVRAWPYDVTDETVVSLESGRVEVTTAARAVEPVVLAPGETIVVTAADVPQPPEALPLHHVMAWRTGGFAFTDSPLASVLDELERRYNIKLTMASPDLATVRVGYLDPNPVSVTDVLSAICISKNLRYRPIANGYEVLKAQS